MAEMNEYLGGHVFNSSKQSMPSLETGSIPGAKAHVRGAQTPGSTPAQLSWDRGTWSMGPLYFPRVMY